MTLRGSVEETYLRGILVYRSPEFIGVSEHVTEKAGKLL